MKAILALVLLFPGCCFPLQADGGFYLNDASRVLIYGDDPARPQLDAAFLETYIATRFPDKEVEIISLQRDAAPEPGILAVKPAVLVLLGGNNPTYSESNELTSKLKVAMPSLRVTMMPFLAPQFRAPADASLDLLVSWNAPAVVSVVEIDAAAKRVVRSENTTVRELESDLVVAWSQDDRSLPLPAGAAPAGGVTRMARMAKINIETLQVRGLGSGQYRFSIDGWSMGEFWRESFENGIDLTLLPTPMLKQADRVRALMLEREEPKRGEWRHAVIPRTHDYEIAPVKR
jgi:hypothetical protein